MSELAQIQVPVNKRSFIVCYIWKDVESLKAATLDHFRSNSHGVEYSDQYDACWISNTEGWKYTEDGLVTDRLGEIHLPIDRMGAGLFAHELQHFLVNWMSCEMQMREDFDLIRDDEEVCLLAGNMTNQFWTAFYDKFNVETTDKE